MVIIQEQTSRHKELMLTLTPLVRAYAKNTVSPKAILDLVSRFASILEIWDFSPKELKGLDRRAFADLIQSWHSEASAQDVALIKAVI